MRQLKKYGNRRLYDTGASRYVNLAEVAGIVRAGEHVRVEDVRDGADITCATLLQVLLEDPHCASVLPCGLLHRVIREGVTPEGRLALGSRLDGVDDDSSGALGRDSMPQPGVGLDWDSAWQAWTAETRVDSRARDDDDDAAAIGALRARLSALEERLR